MGRSSSGVGSAAFERVADRVEWYFGPQIDDLAMASPVPRAALVETLVNLEIAANQRRSLLYDAGDVALRTGDEVVLWIPEGALELLVSAHDTSPLVTMVAQEVMRRLATAMAGRDHDPQPNTVPLVVIRLDDVPT